MTRSMLLLPDRPSLSFLCDRGVSDHHHRHRHHRHAVRRDHRDVFPEILQVRRVQRMQRDEAAGTEFQSLPGEDAERRERSGADADDLPAAAQESEAPTEQQELMTQAVLTAPKVWPVQDEAPEKPKAPQRVQQRLALRFLPVPLPPERQESPPRELSQPAGQRHADAKAQVLRAHSHPKPRSSPVQQEQPELPQRGDADSCQLRPAALVRAEALRPERCRGVAARALQQAQSLELVSRAPTAL